LSTIEHFLDWLGGSQWFGLFLVAYAAMAISISYSMVRWIERKFFHRDIAAEWEAMSDEETLDIIG
jgi:hypothetical protein